ncbi:uncharacterized protein LOC128409867 [Podarcis raffonei]|uniref:uncharacterized protein LOC128409867 n=1 Tax=Podarcis raffonei TaxID=65483 RepID=UPI0023298AB3|nr:uncharacterized protein LOC128409867 [Podarcis raffonei]
MMKLLFPLPLFLLLLCSCSLGKETTNPASRGFPTPNFDVGKHDEWADTSLNGSQESKPELGFPWLLVYLPVTSCHAVLEGDAGTFSPPDLSRMPGNSWCNWTIWAGPHKHILIYIEGFEGISQCEENQDKLIFQGVLSSVESKVTYACRNHGTLVFAAQAVAVHIVFLSTMSSHNHSHKYFKGRYYVFEDYETFTGGERPVVKSNSSAGLSPKSFIMHSQHILDFVNTSRKLSSKNGLPATSKERWWRNGKATSLESFLQPTVSLLKTKKKVTLKPLDMKRIHVAKPTIDDIRNGNITSSSNFKKTLVLESSSFENEDKAIMYKPIASSATLRVSQKVRMMTKLVAMKGHGTVTESVNLQNSGHRTTRWKPAYMSNTGRTILGTSALSGTTFPQMFMEDQRTPVSPPKSIPEKKQEQVPHSLLTNSEFSRKIMDEMELQHLELQEVYTGEQRNNQAFGEENGNRDKYIAVTTAVGKNDSRGAEQLTTEMPDIPTAKPETYLTTVGDPNVLPAPSLRMLNRKLLGPTTTTATNFQAVPSKNSKGTQVEAVSTSPLNNPVTRNTERLQKKRINPNPPYSPSAQVSSHKTSLKAENNSYERDSVLKPHDNYFVLESEHNPGDLLFEISFGIENKGWSSPIGSELEKALIDSIKSQVQEKVKLLSIKVKEVKLKEIIRKEETETDRQNGPNLIFMFWLHLTPEEKNISHLLHLQLEDLGGTSVEVGKVQTVVVRDVNECSSGIGLCGDKAICRNGYGTYICQCKEGYEDRSPKNSGTLCFHNPQTGISSLFRYTEILVGTTVFFICALVVVISVLCSIVRNKFTKKDLHFQEAALPGTSTSFDQNNIHPLLSLDPGLLKLRAKSPERPLQQRTSPSETYRVSIEQSECL